MAYNPRFCSQISCSDTSILTLLLMVAGCGTARRTKPSSLIRLQEPVTVLSTGCAAYLNLVRLSSFGVFRGCSPLQAVIVTKILAECL